MAQIPQAQPLPTGVTPNSFGSGAAEGLQAGAQMNYLASQTRSQDLANQATAYSMTPEMRALAIQQKQAEIAQKQAEAKKEKIGSALSFLGTVGEKVKFFTPQAQKQAIANAMNGLADAAPEWGIQKTDASKIPDEGVDLVQQFGQNYKAYKNGDISEADYNANGQILFTQMTQYQQEMLKNSDSILGSPSYEAGQTPTGTPVAMNTKTGIPTNSTGQPMPGAGFVPAATAASTAAENNRKAIDENEKYKQSVTPFINAHNNFKNMQKIVNLAEKSGSNVDPWSFLNSYVHTIDPNFNGVLNASTYQDLRMAGSPVIASMPWGEKYLKTSKLDPADAMQMLQIAKGQDKIYSKTAGDYRDMTQRHIQSLGGDPSMVTDFFSQPPITRTFKSGRTLTSHDGGQTWQSQ